MSWTAVELRSECEPDIKKSFLYEEDSCIISDFFDLYPRTAKIGPYEVCITNPPFSLAQEFLDRCLPQCKITVMLLRLAFIASEKRADFMRKNNPDLYILPNRPSFSADGATDSADYAWFVFTQGRQGGILKVLDTTPLDERKGRSP